MSTMTCPRRAFKSNRPATIRPVPPTFGVGIFDDDFGDELRDAAFAARMRQIESDEAAWDRTFERANGRPFVRKPYPVSGESLDSARRFGYRVGYSGHECNADMIVNTEEREAYLRGHAEGERDRDREEIAAFERWCAEREMDGPDVWGDPAEYAVGGLVGFGD